MKWKFWKKSALLRDCDGQRCIGPQNHASATGSDVCNVRSPANCEGSARDDGYDTSGFFCTLPKGHEGPHIACGVIHHNFAIWEQEDDSLH